MIKRAALLARVSTLNQAREAYFAEQAKAAHLEGSRRGGQGKVMPNLAEPSKEKLAKPTTRAKAAEVAGMSHEQYRKAGVVAKSDARARVWAGRAGCQSAAARVRMASSCRDRSAPLTASFA